MRTRGLAFQPKLVTSDDILTVMRSKKIKGPLVPLENMLINTFSPRMQFYKATASCDNL